MCKRIPIRLIAIFAALCLLGSGCADKAPPPSGIEMTVLQQPAGTPLTAVQVVVWPLEELDYPLSAGWTDAAGHVAVVLPPTRGHFMLMVQQPPTGYVREQRRDFQLIPDPVHSWVFPLSNQVARQGGILSESRDQDVSAPALSVKIVPIPKPQGK